MSVFDGKISGRHLGLGIALGLLVTVSGCSQPAVDPPGVTESASESASTAGGKQITIAVSEELEMAAKLVADQYEADTGNQASILVIPRNLELAKVQELIRDNPEVDVLAISHDQVHDLASADLIAPLEDFSAVDNFVASSLEAFTARGQLRAIPFSIETSALVCRGSLDAEESVLLNQVIVEFDPFSGNPYQFNLFRTSFGLNLLEPNLEGGFQDAPGLFVEAQDYLTWLKNASRELNLVATGTGVDALANSEDGCLLTGPYDIPRLESVGISEYSIETSFPVVGPLQARPFVESRGLAVLAGSDELAAATKFATEYLASAAFQQTVYDTTGQVSPHRQIEQTEDAKAFQSAAEAGQPRPGNQLLSRFWGPVGIAEAKIVSGEQTAQESWSQLQSALAD